MNVQDYRTMLFNQANSVLCEPRELPGFAAALQRENARLKKENLELKRLVLHFVEKHIPPSPERTAIEKLCK